MPPHPSPLTLIYLNGPSLTGCSTGMGAAREWSWCGRASSAGQPGIAVQRRWQPGPGLACPAEPCSGEGGARIPSCTHSLPVQLWRPWNVPFHGWDVELAQEHHVARVMSLPPHPMLPCGAGTGTPCRDVGTVMHTHPCKAMNKQALNGRWRSCAQTLRWELSLGSGPLLVPTIGVVRVRAPTRTYPQCSSCCCTSLCSHYHHLFAALP